MNLRKLDLHLFKLTPLLMMIGVHKCFWKLSIPFIFIKISNLKYQGLVPAVTIAIGKVLVPTFPMEVKLPST